MDVYSTLFRHVLLPAWEDLRHRPTFPRLAVLERTQWCSSDELLALQASALRRLLVHARDQVPAHRKRLAEAGLDPGAVTDITALRRLPLLSRQDIQADRQAFCAQQGGGPAIHKSTSGSTGTPFRFCYSRDSEVWRQAIKLRGYGWAGYQPGDKTVHYWGPPAVVPRGLPALKIGLDRALRREVYLDCAKQGEHDLQKAARTLARLRPKVLIGYTQALVELGRKVLSHGWRDWPAMQVLCGAERLWPADRPVLEAAFGAPGTVFETYGCREFMLIASECEAHQLHQSMETLVVEVVDEEGQPVPRGMVGQVVVTDLYNDAMPLIRYRTGDLATAAGEQERCACGRGLLRLASLAGREQDMLRGADGRSIPGMVFIALFANLGERVRRFQAIQRRDGHIDLLVVPGPEFDAGVVEGVKARLRPYLGEVSLTVNLVPAVADLPSGKRRFVVVEE